MNETFVAFEEPKGCLESGRGSGICFEVTAMARRALQGHTLIDEHFLIVYHAYFVVTLVAFHVGMTPRQRELRALVMIKRGRHPFLRIVAIRAHRLSGFCDKLSVVGILMAFLAFLGRTFELRFLRAGNRFMT